MTAATSELFIKVYPERLRALIRQHHLRRVEAAELLYLALYIDDQGICWPSKGDSVEKVGMKSSHWARKLHSRLKKKGVLDWDFDHDKRSPRFHLPNAFFYGSDSYHDRNTESRGDRNTESGTDRDSESRGDRNTDPEQEPSRTRTNRTRTLTNKQTGALNDAGFAPTRDQRHLIRRLTEAGVSDLEAVLIAQQYKQETIDKAIADSARPGIANRGGWVRSAIERIANQDIQYPAVSHKQLVAQAAMAVAAARGNPYLDDEYFERHGDTYSPDGDTYSASDGDTYSAGDGDTHSWPGGLTGARQPF